MKYLAFVFIHHWRITAILALFAIATTAGFMGAFKRKSTSLGGFMPAQQSTSPMTGMLRNTQFKPTATSSA